MTRDELRAEIADILGVDAEAVTEETGKENTPEWDSMAALQIISLLDQEVDGEIEAEQAEKLTSFAAVTELAREHGVLSD